MNFLNLSRKTIARIAVIIFLCGFAFGTVYFTRPAPHANSISPEPSATPPRRTRAVPKRTSATPARRNYSEFPHNVKAHQKNCADCHKFPSENWKKVRSEADAFPDITDYPQHASCIGCHRQQFFSGRPPTICTICHTNPGPRNSNRHPFPNPREIFDRSPKGQKAAESDFQVFFPHDKHIEIVSSLDSKEVFVKASFNRPRAAETSCTVCHKTYQPAGDSPDEYLTKPPADLGDAFWLKKGTFKTAPIGNTVCFTCHSQDSGLEPSPANCGTCHKLRVPDPQTDFDPAVAARVNINDRMLMLTWRHRDSSATFRHEFSMHADMECATCHNVTAMNTLDKATKKVPVSACATCHVTSTVDEGGALNYEADQRKKDPSFKCVKCHIAYGKLPIPDSHIKALAGQ